MWVVGNAASWSMWLPLIGLRGAHGPFDVADWTILSSLFSPYPLFSPSLSSLPDEALFSLLTSLPMMLLAGHKLLHRRVLVTLPARVQTRDAPPSDHGAVLRPPPASALPRLPPAAGRAAPYRTTTRTTTDPSRVSPPWPPRPRHFRCPCYAAEKVTTSTTCYPCSFASVCSSRLRLIGCRHRTSIF